MGALTEIAWCDSTFNPWIGCTKVSEGCRFCYAEDQMANRWKKVQWGPGAARSRTSPKNWALPKKWNKEAKAAGERRRVFCASLADVFDPEVADHWREDLFDLVGETPDLDWLLLTKRPDVAKGYIEQRYASAARGPNVWLGVSVEDQKTADERIPILLQTQAAVRFVSYEPALGPVDLGLSTATCDCCDRWRSRWVRLKQPVGPDMPHLFGEDAEDHVADAGIYRADSNQHGALSVDTPKGLIGIKPAEFECLPYRLDWVIVGGESGKHARPFDVEWARSTVQQCRHGGAAPFVKQLGAIAVDSSFGESDGTPGLLCGLKDKKGGDMAEWPADLQVREFPEKRR